MRLIALLMLALTLSACATTPRDWVPQGSPVVVNDPAVTPPQLLRQSPDEIVVGYRELLRQRYDPLPTVSTRYRMCERYQTVAGRIVVLCWTPNAYLWYADPVLVCRLDWQLYGVYEYDYYRCQVRR
jgi:hypothetical protein